MKNLFFDIVVKKLTKNPHRVIDLEMLKALLQRVMGDEYTEQKMYKMVYYLRNRGYLICLKKNIYFVQQAEEYFSQERFLDHFYWKLLKKHCKQFLRGDRYIGGLKALEFHMQSYEIPDEILIVTGYKQATEVVMLEKKMLCKTYATRGKNVFFHFKKYVSTYTLRDTISLPLANLEIALLESLYNPSTIHKLYTDELVKRALKKYTERLNLNVWKHVLQLNKHHSSMQRLRVLAEQVNPELADNIKELIRKYSYMMY